MTQLLHLILVVWGIDSYNVIFSHLVNIQSRPAIARVLTAMFIVVLASKTSGFQYFCVINLQLLSLLAKTAKIKHTINCVLNIWHMHP